MKGKKLEKKFKKMKGEKVKKPAKKAEPGKPEKKEAAAVEKKPEAGPEAKMPEPGKPEAKKPAKKKKTYKKAKRKWVPSEIYDADGVVLGRLATRVAKESLAGKNILIVNAEKAIISGDPSMVFRKYQGLRKDIGSRYKGPFYSRRPDFFVRRVVRGMLPWKRSRGREAYRRIRASIGVPAEFEGKETIKMLSNLNTLRCITVKKLCSRLGWE